MNSRLQVVNGDLELDGVVVTSYDKSKHDGSMLHTLARAVSEEVGYDVEDGIDETESLKSHLSRLSEHSSYRHLFGYESNVSFGYLTGFEHK